MANYLVVDGISYSYHNLKGETIALQNVSFEVAEGEFMAIVGPSGCGKSTLLSLIAGLIQVESGAIYIQGEKAEDKKTAVGYMLQKDHLLEWRSTYGNITLGLEIQKKDTPENLRKLDELMEAYGLSAFRNAKPKELSGGMRQRAALIRTLLLQPDILLLDEPFSALDYQTRLEVADDICKIIRIEGKTAILITHDISEAISVADRVLVLGKRPATVKSIHQIHLTTDDRSPMAARRAPEFSHYFNLIWKEMTEA